MIKIETTKRVNSAGEFVYHVDSVDAIKLDQLPKMYTRGYPCCFKECFNNDHIIIATKNKYAYVIVGKEYTIKEMERRMELLKECGIRLKVVNSILVQHRRRWTGKKDFEI